ncbi:ParB N-terminal domain-containing protein [Corynebacterium amycolatum]|uniref:ParB N-terminal domain-containing protein n=1 Tax=Corynebacterium amycolatum TaxID=43765 RepID=UPI002AAD585F|nr:ParB N-terminal domain-containing protein [Corynebacterium amycolatum]MDY7341355.1 ParB N-terminal domain-containing protein [Corynebacterium amycolatum]
MVEIHPYIADLPIFQDRVDAMAESIAEIGLLHPISLDSEGRVIGGRHRLAACAKADVEPQFETWDGDPLAFMLSDNDDRKHQTVGQLAAEKAITLAKAGRRENGRWKRGTTSYLKVLNSDKKSAGVMLSSAGLILDVLGEGALRSVASGEVPFSEVQEKAVAEKQRREAEERARVEEARDEQKREDSAGRYFDNHQEAKAWLDEKPQGAFPTMREAYAAYMEHDREARRIEAEKRRAEAEAKRIKQERLERHARHVGSFVHFFNVGVDMAKEPERQEILDTCDQHVRNEFLEIEAKYLKGRD